MKAKPTQSTDVDSRTVEAGNDFGFRLMAELAGKTLRDNVFISPFSISVALAMTAAGARGETLAAMQETLGLAGLDETEVSRTFAALIADSDRLSPGVQLAIANSLWISLHEELRAAYVEHVRAVFRAEAVKLDFGQPDEAAGIINAWVAERTADKIKDLLTPGAVANAALVLVNAIYFKGTWEAQFDPAMTEDGPFNLLSGDEKTLPMMRRSGKYRYYEDETLQAIRLPFDGEQTSMIVVLPREDTDFDAFRRKFGVAEFARLPGHLQPGEGQIVLPRFKVSCKATLNQPLTAMGMGIAFGGDADFSGIAKTGQFISAVIHQAVMEVNEEGAEAAAATGVVMTRAMLPLTRFEMTVNRPFFCALLDEDSGAILFMGWIAEPD
jgi:serpin B